MNNERQICSMMHEQEIELDKMYPNRILHHILENSENMKDYLYLISGKVGPTGKTWLYTALRNNGYNAIEMTEDIFEYVVYRDNKNHYYVNPNKKLIIIILNERLI